MGDFNDLLYSTDKKGVHPHPEYLMRGFRHALDDTILSEMDLEGGCFTWEKSRGKDNWVQEKLDRAFATVGWWSLFPLCKLTLVTTAVSDHEAILLDLLSVDIPKKSFRFKFENTWLKEPSFVKDVTRHWEDLPPSHLLPKLVAVSGYMQKWGRNCFNKFKEKVKIQKAVIDSLRDKSDDQGVKEYLQQKSFLMKLFYTRSYTGSKERNNFGSKMATRTRSSFMQVLLLGEKQNVSTS
ncbi:hypothetical protein AgCh_010508 [Apium graveolens]